MKRSTTLIALSVALTLATPRLDASSEPIRGRSGMVASQKMLASEAGLGVLRDAGRFHHPWLPDRVTFEAKAFSPDTLALLRSRGHVLETTPAIGCAQVIVYNREEGVLEGGSDLRRRDGGVAAY